MTRESPGEKARPKRTRRFTVRLVSAFRGLPFVSAFLVASAYLLFPCPARPGWIDSLVASASGVRPPAGILPGLWQTVVSCFPPGVDFFPCLSGALSAALFAGLCCSAFRLMLRLVSRQPGYGELWEEWLLPVIAFVGSLLASFAEPVWSLFAFFAPGSLSLVCFVASCQLFLAWILFGGWWRLSVLMFLAGALLAETPLALLVLAGAWLVHLLVWRGILDGRYSPRRNYPRLGQIPIWRMTFALLAGLAAVAGLNVLRFILGEGPRVLELPRTGVAFLYVREWLGLLSSAASGDALLLGFCLCVVPLLVCLRAFAQTTGREETPPFYLGVAVAFCGIAAYFQQGQFPDAWFWTWVESPGFFVSPMALGILSSLATAAVVLAYGIFAFDAVHRNDQRPWSVNSLYRIFLIFLALAMFAAVCWRMPHAKIRALCRLKRQVVREIVNETRQADCLFADGVLDAAVELESRRVGGSLKVVNLVASPSPYEKYLRMRGIGDARLRVTAAQGASGLLARCARETNALGRVALQLGVEQWLEAGGELEEPSALTVCATPASLRRDPPSDLRVQEFRRSSLRAFRDLSGRLVGLSSKIRGRDVPESVRTAFLGISWNLMRFARLRNEHELADRLEAVGGLMRKMLPRAEYERLQAQARPTPEVALERALRREDFAAAAPYARRILRDDSENLTAVFALGMDFFASGDYRSAELYLRKFLLMRPDDPVVLNNLSVVCRKTSRYDEAVDLARRAAALLPDDARIQKTLADALSKAP